VNTITDILLKKIRLSYYFIILFIIFAIIEFFVPHYQFTGGALTLFSVNSFLYGFYISPILGAQKTRIEDLHKIVRSESNAIFGMIIEAAKLPTKQRDHIKQMFLDYVDHVMRHRRPAGGEERYEAIIGYCLDYQGEHQAEIDKLLSGLVANQQNRTDYAMQLNDKVYSNEWMVMVILFSITLSFILLLDVGTGYIYRILAALLCTGLSMLIIILVKMSTLTHKKAKEIWSPYKKLIDTKFYRID
jgi:hypothetical protein